MSFQRQAIGTVGCSQAYQIKAMEQGSCHSKGGLFKKSHFPRLKQLEKPLAPAKPAKTLLPVIQQDPSICDMFEQVSTVLDQSQHVGSNTSWYVLMRCGVLGRVRVQTSSVTVSSWTGLLIQLPFQRRVFQIGQRPKLKQLHKKSLTPAKPAKTWLAVIQRDLPHSRQV